MQVKENKEYIYTLTALNKTHQEIKYKFKEIERSRMNFK